MSGLLRSLVMLSGLGLLMALAACTGQVRPEQQLQSVVVPAPRPATRAIVVLPGRGDDLAGLQQSGIVSAIQRQWPDADVVLADVPIAVYRGGNMPERLHADVMVPTHARGYEQVWLAGASMGGMGVILYDRAYPATLDGLILMAPYLGGRTIQREIDRAGGLAAWEPGPLQQIDAGNWQRELWRHLQALTRDPHQQRRVWLLYGEDDRLRRAIALLTPYLLPDQILVRAGGHKWAVWNPAMAEVLAIARPE